MKKNLFIKITALALSISLLTIPSVRASSVAVSSETKISTIIRLGIFKGDTDGNLRLDDTIIRGELITAFVRVLGLESSIEETGLNVTFTDIDTSHWAYKYIATALKNNLIAGYPDNTVGANSYITYSEALTLIIRALGYQSALNTGSWPENAINKCYELGIIESKNNSPDRLITRGEVASLIYNSLTVEVIR